MNIDQIALLRRGSGRRFEISIAALLFTLPLMALATAPDAFGQGLKITRLNPKGATSAVAIGLNKTNQVVGNYTIKGGTVKGFEFASNKYTTIVFPGSKNFTRANGINDTGEIAGDFFGTDNWYHGFTDAAGTFTQYDLPGGLGNFSTSIFAVNNNGDTAGAAGGGTLGSANEGWVNIAGTVTTFYGSGTDNTYAFSINSTDEFVGQYIDSSNLSHGYSGTISGGKAVITEIVFPGAVQTACEGINDSGEITGYYIDSAGIGHGFTDIGGVFATSDLPFIASVNAGGSYVGDYFDPTGMQYGYVASPQSFKPTTVKVSKAISTSTFGVNNSGVLVGQYTDSTNTTHGLILSGTTVTNVDDASGVAGSTLVNGINTAGTAVGYYLDTSNLAHCFLYSGGKFTNDFIPGATQAEALGINDAGDISGVFVDASNAEHGFLLKGGVGGTLTQLDVPGATYTFGWGINASDTVTLIWGNSKNNAESSTYNATTKAYTTVNVPGAVNVYAHSINKTGAIAYAWSDASGNYHAGLLSGGSYYLLDEASGSNIHGDGINDTGLMVGRYYPTRTTTYQGFKGQK
ncbi:MAG TPA: hypothetical protein VG206_17180 [Terriglobia bacterium]|nr:hypothetical protein [Terriglobia bacterium]